MKALHALSFVICLMIVGAGTLSATGGGAGQGTGIAGNGVAGNAGTSSASGHAASAPTGVHVGSAATAGSNAGNHAGDVSRSGTPVSVGAPRSLSGGFTPALANRAPLGVGANASRTFNNPSAPRPQATGTATTVRTAPPFPAARVRNAWTDSAPARVPNAAGWTRSRDDDRRRGNFTGTILYPNAGRALPGDRRERGPGSSFAGSDDNRRSYGDRFRHRGYYCNPYIYGYPGVLIGGYVPFFYGDVNGGYSEGADLGADVAASNEPSPAAVDALSQPYPNGNAVIQPPIDPAENASQAAPATQNLQSNNGPDSLVEAVQAELSRRGYFGGKVDAIYNEATHTAIQRFQQDQKLPASGRINEATLHALQLD